jgi:hypothetical protein
MPPHTLTAVETAVRRSWSVETCDPADAAQWTGENPALGQCGSTALVVQDLMGGELLSAEVQHADGSRQGWHNWNRLPGGLEIDLTREQFRAGEVIKTPNVVARRGPLPGRAVEEYLRLRASVLTELGLPLPHPPNGADGRSMRTQSMSPLK